MISNENPFVKCLEILSGFVITIIFIILLLLSGCRSVRTEYIPVESTIIKTDTIHHTRNVIERDTVIRIERVAESRLDSIAPILDSIGRMIGYDRWHIIDRSASLQESNSRLKAMIDSLKSQRDQTEIKWKPYPVEKIVETNRLYWWQKALIGVGIVAVVGMYCRRLADQDKEIKIKK
ncbi:MAG: hypothetical protein K2M31_09415 [Muribaculaceae bacterium]|nr:hypothetical protein [Muribaculaceae bacterium]